MLHTTFGARWQRKMDAGLLEALPHELDAINAEHRRKYRRTGE